MSGSFVDGLSEEELSAYAGRWIAYVGTRIVGQGDTPQQALAAAKSARFKEVPQVVYIPISYPDTFFEQIKLVVQALPPDVSVYLIGGAIRDVLLGKATHDLDFTLAGDVFHISRRVADKIGAAFYPLDEERNTARLVLNKADGSRVTYDFAALRGENLEEDLRSRDFTINAMAIDVRQPAALLDPLSGAADLHAKRLRACSPTAISDDPVRILRAVRLAAAYNLHILPETLSQLRQAAPQLANVSTERVRDELFRILAGPRPATSLRALDMLGVFSVTLPELMLLKDLEQTPPHILDAWRHTLDVVQKLEVITNALSLQFNPDEAANLLIGLAVMKLGKYRQQIGRHLELMLNPDRSVKSLLFFAALFHDIGKPETRQRDEKGGIHFFGHEKAGEQIAAQRAQALRLSNAEVERVRLVIRGHLRPLQLSNAPHLPTRKAIYHFFRDTGAAGVDICLLSLADLLGTYGSGLPGDLWAQHLEIVRLLLEAWYEKPEESISPPALLNGHDLMSELHLQAGPIVGQLLAAIQEAQATGQIHTRQEAFDLSKGLLPRLLDTS
jgi:putative nucleotidyltransferase with HDIG domain